MPEHQVGQSLGIRHTVGICERSGQMLEETDQVPGGIDQCAAVQWHECVA
jgi:hypothetical protein